MDPNANQPLGTNPITQPVTPPVAQPVPSTADASMPPMPGQIPTPIPTTSTPNLNSDPMPGQTPSFATTGAMPETPKKKGGKTVALLIILLLLVLGMAAYIMFAKQQVSKTDESVTDTNVSTPAPTIEPTIAPEQDIEISSPEADLQNIETDVNGL